MKNKRALWLFCIIFIFFSILPLNTKAADENNKHIILIDPGHGGIDGGAKSKNATIEKDINLEISRKLKKSLENNGYEVHMTREDDSQLDRKKVNDLNKRCNMKKETNCDVFISIHQNMFPQSNCFGAQVWYSANENSSLLASNIQTSLKETINDNNKRLAKPAKEQYRILRDGYDGACVIVECGFLSNSEEEGRLKNDEHQNKIAEAITNGVKKYFDDKAK